MNKKKVFVDRDLRKKSPNFNHIVKRYARHSLEELSCKYVKKKRKKEKKQHLSGALLKIFI